jgi:hypothetical protein
MNVLPDEAVISCRAAAQGLRSYRCTRVSGGQFGGQWRCVRGAKAYRLEFGD